MSDSDNDSYAYNDDDEDDYVYNDDEGKDDVEDMDVVDAVTRTTDGKRNVQSIRSILFFASHTLFLSLFFYWRHPHGSFYRI